MQRNNFELRRFGVRDYAPICARMREFTATRDASTPDQIWLLQHNPVFTRGVSCKATPRAIDKDDTHAHTAARDNLQRIPVVDSDRGGQMTYHAPGQLIAYLLLDIKRRGLGAKSLVHKIEQTIIDLLRAYSVVGVRRCGAPGVYVGDAKIAALGLRVKRGCCFHGLSLNVAMDLRPYQRIDPCGRRNLAVTQLAAHVARADIAEVEESLAKQLQLQFN